MRRQLIVSAVAVGLGGLLAAPGEAATTLGSKLSSAGDASAISGDGAQPEAGTALNVTIPGRATTAPAAGVITKFRVRNGSGTLKLVVIDGSAGSRSVVASSAAVSASGSAVQGFAVSPGLQIAAGQTVGIELEEGAKLGLAHRAGARVERYAPPLSSARDADYTTPTDVEWVYNAVVEADADNDGLGDETQDPDHGGAGGGGGGGDISKLRVDRKVGYMDTAGHIERTIGCPDDSPARCIGVIKFSFNGEQIGLKGFAVGPGRNTQVTIKVSSAVRTLLREKKTRTISVKTTLDGVSGAKRTSFKLKT